MTAPTYFRGVAVTLAPHLPALIGIVLAGSVLSGSYGTKPPPPTATPVPLPGLSGITRRDIPVALLTDLQDLLAVYRRTLLVQARPMPADAYPLDIKLEPQRGAR